MGEEWEDRSPRTWRSGPEADEFVRTCRWETENLTGCGTKFQNREGPEYLSLGSNQPLPSLKSGGNPTKHTSHVLSRPREGLIGQLKITKMWGRMSISKSDRKPCDPQGITCVMKFSFLPTTSNVTNPTWDQSQLKQQVCSCS